jgi:hypothetical protein
MPGCPLRKVREQALKKYSGIKAKLQPPNENHYERDYHGR